jgi:hypothetical protein
MAERTLTAELQQAVDRLKAADNPNHFTSSEYRHRLDSLALVAKNTLPMLLAHIAQLEQENEKLKDQARRDARPYSPERLLKRLDAYVEDFQTGGPDSLQAIVRAAVHAFKTMIEQDSTLSSAMEELLTVGAFSATPSIQQPSVVDSTCQHGVDCFTRDAKDVPLPNRINYGRRLR